MREIVIPFLTTVTTDSTEYQVRAVGNQRADGIWEGHIEFQSDSGERLVTGLETTQTDATALQEWASSLAKIYVDSALRRARMRRAVRSRASHSERREESGRAGR
jgi:hypothetical protein